MSSQQQALLLDTIVGLKKALKRKAYDSDSDSSVEHNTNRGHKLQKRARFVRQGNLAPSMAPPAYKELAEHAGYQRAIINRNPPLIDEEGYEIDSDDNDERVQEAIAEAAEANPYSSIRLEQIFGPLTSIINLPNHPSLSRPFVSKALTELATQGLDLMHKENAALWKAKPLLTRLHGDHTWAPCGIMVDLGDTELFSEDFIAQFQARPPQASTIGSAPTPIAIGEGRNGVAQQASTGAATSITEAAKVKNGVPRGDDQTKESSEGTEVVESSSRGQEQTTSSATRDVISQPTSTQNKSDETMPPIDAGKEGGKLKTNGTASNDTHKDDGQEPNHGERKAVASGAEEADIEMAGPLDGEGSSRKVALSYHSGSRGLSITPDVADDLYIHPLFLAPRSARPDRDLGLPDQEAEDVRRLLQLYVQKQEEVCRGTKRLYEGILRADRYRKTVWKWAKAEAHCGTNRDMSDGEDWYDKEEWGLVDDLKKGQDEEEEDTAQTQKKTRNRR